MGMAFLVVLTPITISRSNFMPRGRLESEATVRSSMGNMLGRIFGSPETNRESEFNTTRIRRPGCTISTFSICTAVAKMPVICCWNCCDARTSPSLDWKFCSSADGGTMVVNALERLSITFLDFDSSSVEMVTNKMKKARTTRYSPRNKAMVWSPRPPSGSAEMASKSSMWTNQNSPKGHQFRTGFCLVP